MSQLCPTLVGFMSEDEKAGWGIRFPDLCSLYLEVDENLTHSISMY